MSVPFIMVMLRANVDDVIQVFIMKMIAKIDQGIGLTVVIDKVQEKTRMDLSWQLRFCSSSYDK
jgi:hypothetical protein